MKIEKILITPEMAKKLLEMNTNNRNVNESYVYKYAREISNGTWKENTGELIKISKNNIILDGQHRLLAIVKANKSVYFHLATGMDYDNFKVLDTGKTRNAGDIFKLAGVKNYNNVSSIIQLYNNIHNNKSKAIKATNTTALRPQELLNAYEEQPEYWQTVFNLAQNLHTKFQRIWNLTEIGMFIAVFDNCNMVKSREFIRQICEGVNVTNNVVIILRNKLIADKVSVNKKMSVTYRRALVIKSWNAFYTGRDLKVLKFNSDVEEYPEIIGLD